MRIVRYAHPSGPRHGSLDDDDTVHAIDGDIFGDYSVGDPVGSVDDLKLLAPVEPGKAIGVGLNYMEHIMETVGESGVPKMPMLFIKPTTAISGPGDDIVLPRGDGFRHAINDPALQDEPFGEVHYEAELVVVMGKTCRNVDVSDALDYVFGYTCGNDVSARKLQFAEMAMGCILMGKGLDTFAPLGPCIVTDIDPNNLRIQARVNGETKQDNNTSDMLFNVASLVTYLAQGLTLEPGDCIFTGTPEGVGPLAPGDSVEIELENIGVLRNPVVAA